MIVRLNLACRGIQFHHWRCDQEEDFARLCQLEVCDLYFLLFMNKSLKDNDRSVPGAEAKHGLYMDSPTVSILLHSSLLSSFNTNSAAK